MNALLMIALVFSTIVSDDDFPSGNGNAVDQESRIETSRNTGPRLSPEEFVLHYAALSRLLQESQGNWELFEEKRKTYMTTHSLTEEDLTTFVTDMEREPEFWVNLWAQILGELDMAPGDSLPTEP